MKFLNKVYSIEYGKIKMIVSKYFLALSYKSIITQLHILCTKLHSNEHPRYTHGVWTMWIFQWIQWVWKKWLLDLCWVSNIIHFLLTLQRNMAPWAQRKTMSTVLISKENDSLIAILIGNYKKKKKFPKLLWSSRSKKGQCPSFPGGSGFQESCTERFVPWS